MNEQPSGDKLPPVPETLSEWLDTKLPAAAFLNAAKSANRDIGDADAAAAMKRVAETPALAARIADLVRASVAMPRPLPLRGSVLRLGSELISIQAPNLTGWLKDASANSSSEVEALGEALAPALRNRAVRRQAEAILDIGLQLLVAKREATSDQLMRAAAIAYGLEQTPAAGDTRVARKVDDLLRKCRPRQLGQFALVESLSRQKVDEADAARIRANAETAHTVRRAEAAEARVRQLESEIARLDGDLSLAKDELATAKSRTASAQTVGAHDLAGLRARYRRVVGGQLKQFLSDARDSLEIDPPKPDFAHQYLNDALETIEDEIQWLSEPSA